MSDNRDSDAEIDAGVDLEEPSRRIFLKRAGAAGALTVGLAACSGSEILEPLEETATAVPAETPTVTPVPETPPPTAAPTPTPPPVSSPTMITGSFGDLTKSKETWNQPAPWRPRGERELCLRVVENESNLRFSYGGSTPGPTIRMGGTDTLRIIVQNELGLDQGMTTIGPSPGGLGAGGVFPGPEGAAINALFKKNPTGVYGGTVDNPIINKIPTEPKEDWCLGEHVNGIHSAHVTNLHTHGLHVTSGLNPDGTHSDNIFLRIVPHQDWLRIQENPECVEEFQEKLSLKGGDIVDSDARFEFRIGNTAAVPVHPPGTHWYHPHSHGSTQNQVSSGMAGFLIVEGDVDAAVREAFKAVPDGDPYLPSGPRDYQERDMFIQRLFNNTSKDPDKNPKNDAALLGLTPTGANAARPHVNGTDEPNVITMRPGAVERWRILNGSVDGSAYIRFMVLKGRFELATVPTVNNKGEPGMGPGIVLVDESGDSAQVVKENEFSGTIQIGSEIEPISNRKQHLWQLAHDGVTLVTNSETSPEYYVKDLKLASAQYPDGQPEPDFLSLEDCYEGDNAKLCYVRPNELALAAANRVDVFFEAPQLSASKSAEVYTVLGMPTKLHTTSGGVIKPPTVVAHVVVKGKPVDEPSYAFANMPLPPVPDYLWPIPDAELAVSEFEQGLGYDSGFRSRTVRYAGWGHATSPRIDVPADEADKPENLAVEKLLWYRSPEPNANGLLDGNLDPISELRPFAIDEFPPVLLVPNTRTMSIDGHKFEPSSNNGPIMWVDTAEEWAVYNESLEAWAIKPPNKITEEYASTNQADQIWYTYVDANGDLQGPLPWGNPAAHAIWPFELDAVNDDREAKGLAPLERKLPGGADHPFHIHQNPFWLMRLEVPNTNGELINVLQEPMWADVTYLPRSGGRAVFRSRFMDYTGEYVNHCHILPHEDNGMMQRVQVLAPPGDERYDQQKPNANYDVISRPVTSEMPADEVNAIYEPPTPRQMYSRSAAFIDANNSGQIYPLPSGWIPEAPDPV